MTPSRFVVSVMLAVAIVPGCSMKDSPPASSSVSASVPNPTAPSPAFPTAPSPAAMTVAQFDPQWLDLETPRSWTESDRRITGGFQQFGLRPVDETEMPRKCNGCGERPPTAFLTAYAPGTFDPTEARTGDPVTVNADGDGFFRASRDSEDAVLVWKYAENAWATVRGRTTITSEPGRMTELARALRPGDRSPIPLPLGIPGLPASLPLAEISTDRGAYGTTLRFAACGTTDTGAIPDCYGEGETMSVQIWPDGGYSGHIDEQSAAPMGIGGRDGLYDAASNKAAVRAAPDMLVVFELSAPFGTPGQSPTKPQTDLREILATAVWASEPGDEQTWIPVADWVKPS